MPAFSARQRRTAAIFCTLLAVAAAAPAQEQHADYVVIGKSINHRQSADGALELLNTVFFAEVFKTASGTVTNAVLEGPGDAAEGLPFPDGDILFLAGERQRTIAELTRHFPDDTYYFSFDTPDGNVRRMPATFRRDRGEIRNPGPIEVTLFQGGRPADPRAIDPDRDLVVRWSPFEKGSADPNGVIDDMIYVMMGDCMGVETVHSGHALSNPDALTFAADEFVIPAGKLHAGRPFQLEIEHSNMDTAVWQGMEQIITYAATTFLDIRTVGGDAGDCPDVPYAMDGGQTDRVRRH